MEIEPSPFSVNVVVPPIEALSAFTTSLIVMPAVIVTLADFAMSPPGLLSDKSI